MSRLKQVAIASMDISHEHSFSTSKTIVFFAKTMQNMSLLYYIWTLRFSNYVPYEVHYYYLLKDILVFIHFDIILACITFRPLSQLISTVKRETLYSYSRIIGRYCYHSSVLHTCKRKNKLIIILKL